MRMEKLQQGGGGHDLELYFDNVYLKISPAKLQLAMLMLHRINGRGRKQLLH